MKLRTTIKRWNRAKRTYNQAFPNKTKPLTAKNTKLKSKYFHAQELSNTAYFKLGYYNSKLRSAFTIYVMYGRKRMNQDLRRKIRLVNKY